MQLLVDTCSGNGILFQLEKANLDLGDIHHPLHTKNFALEDRQQKFNADAKKYFNGNVIGTNDLDGIPSNVEGIASGWNDEER